MAQMEMCSIVTTYGLQGLLDLAVESTGLEGDDGRGSLRVVGNGRTALGAEDAVDGQARAASLGIGLSGTVDGQRVLRDNGDQS
jgi:hypothetical protein